MKTGTQNRPYHTEKLMVQATFTYPVEGRTTKDTKTDTLVFDWNNRDEVRNFAAQSDRIIREGGMTTIIQANSNT